MSFSFPLGGDFIPLFCRIFWFLVAAPFLWLASTPRFLTIWLCLVFSTSLALHGESAGTVEVFYPKSGWMEYLKESVVGLLSGLLFRLIVESIKAYGDIVASITGLNNVVFRTTDSTDQSAFLSGILGLLAVICVFQSGAFIQSLEFLNSVSTRGRDWSGSTLDPLVSVSVISWALSIALQLSIPVVILSLVVNVCAGYLNRLMPQASFYFLTSPVVMILGLILVAQNNEFLVRAVLERVLSLVR